MSINLLPWRAKQRQQRKNKRRLLFFVTVVLVNIVMFFIHSMIQNTINEQLLRNKRLLEELQVLEKPIKELERVKNLHGQFLHQLKTLQTSQEENYRTLQFFTVLLQILPEQVYLTQIKRLKNQIILSGCAPTSHDLSQFMGGIRQNALLNIPILTSFNHQKFNIMVMLRDPNESS